MSNLIRTQVLFPAATYDFVKQEAAEKGISFSAAIRRAVDLVYRREKRTAASVFLKKAQKLSSPVGAPKDLSTNDDYLYGVKSL